MLKSKKKHWRSLGLAASSPTTSSDEDFSSKLTTNRSSRYSTRNTSTFYRLESYVFAYDWLNSTTSCFTYLASYCTQQTLCRELLCQRLGKIRYKWKDSWKASLSLLYLLASRDWTFIDKPKKMTQYAHRYESIPQNSGQQRSLSLLI